MAGLLFPLSEVSSHAHPHPQRRGARGRGPRRRRRHRRRRRLPRRPGRPELGRRTDQGARHQLAERALPRPDRGRARTGLDGTREPVARRALLRLRLARPRRRRHLLPGAVPAARGDRPAGGAEDRAGQEHLPHAARPEGRRPVLRLRHALPLPGPRGGHSRRDHPHQPRRRRSPSRDAARDDRAERHHGAPAVRRRDVGPVGEAAALHLRVTLHRRRLAGHDRRPVDRREPPGHPGHRRLRGHPERLGGQPVDRRGRRRQERHGEHVRQAAEQLRLPLQAVRRDRPDQGRQAAGAAGRLARRTRASRSRSTGRRPARATGAQADADILSADTKDLHSYGKMFTTKFVTIHDTATDGTAPFSANAAAKAGKGTPFKRPENGQFLPGSGFRSFVFDETGDTDNRTQAAPDFGGFGGLQRLDSPGPDRTPASCGSSTRATRRTAVSTT